ncbi:hypothetical protein [Tardiphaga sp. P9-11]|uniref:hypothetical protein n=1 Tax=Tardiphaga sp. P9-11 TaxID=2024614 RepID=UPI0011F357AD|nr:hypothetical protein [Tardiphaga sp. P9-11]
MTQLFEILRNEQDQGRLAQQYMQISTSSVVSGPTPVEQAAMIASCRIERSHRGYGSLDLRDTLNKIAHHDTGLVSFRVDNRGAHYLILGGSFRGSRWISEILVAKLCKNAAAAVKAIR